MPMVEISEDSAPNEGDWACLRGWTGEAFQSAARLPISFTYDGNAVRGLPDDWHPVRQQRRLSSTVSETVFRGRHGPSGLEASVEVISYDDYPVVEWTAWFTNPTDRPSAILERPLALDASFRGQGLSCATATAISPAKTAMSGNRPRWPAWTESGCGRTWAARATAPFPISACCSSTAV